MLPRRSGTAGGVQGDRTSHSFTVEFAFGSSGKRRIHHRRVRGVSSILAISALSTGVQSQSIRPAT